LSVPVFLDTSILIYSISLDQAEAEKRQRAAELLRRDDGALSIQVLQEFYTQATRPTRPHRLSHDIAADLITAWTRFPIQEMTLALFKRALEIKRRYDFSYWNSAIIAAAQALGCSELYTEDMSHGRQIEDVTIVNPFR
jgi:predicted nucleic acid-binding protein